MKRSDNTRETAIKKNSKKKRARRKRRLVAFFSAFLLVAVCVLAVLCATIWFPVKSVTTAGDSIYSKNDIIKASGITLDEDNLIMLSSKNVKNKISQKLPYSGEITVEKIFPETVKITVNTAVPKYYIIDGGIYAVLDSDLKVVEKTAQQPENIIFIKTEKIPEYKLGQRLTFSDTDGALINKLLKNAEEKGVNVTGVDVSDTIDIKLIVDGRILLLLGADMDIDYKILHFATMYKKMDPASKGVATLKDWTSSNTKSTFRDVNIDPIGFCELGK